MKFLKWLIVVLLLVGLIVFFGVPLLVGTTWAKENIRTAMAQETGREVSIGSVSFSWFSGLAVSEVTVHQSQPEFEKEGPLFHLGSLKLEVGIRDVLAKKINVEEFSIVEPRIVVVRDADGRFNFDDLMKKPGEEPAPAPEPSGEDGTPGKAPEVEAKLNIREGRVLYIDVPLGTRVEMDDIDTTATWVNGKLVMDMGFLLNGGDVSMKGNLDLSQDPAPFHLEEMVIDEATLGTNLAALAYFLPVLGKDPQTASGKLRFSLKDVSGEGFTLKQLAQSLNANGGLNL
ncbi:MAG: AsmA family protein, partial [Planctomycetota bacterium]